MVERFIQLGRGVIDFFALIFRRRFLIWEMAKRDMVSQYVGSWLGIVWTFITPLVMILVLWLVFSIGFRTAPRGGVPFVVWLACGMAIWNTFAEAVSGSTNAILANPHLVKKVLFPLSILPIVKLVVAFITHAVFLLLLVALIAMYGLPANLFWLQALYYFFAMSCLALGISWFSSSLNVFVRDTAQVVTVLLQLGFWATPIFWDIGMMPDRIQFILKLNPMFYLVQGYRDSFIYFVPFWQRWEAGLYYWGVTFLFFVVGAAVFMRLRSHFADVV